MPRVLVMLSAAIALVLGSAHLRLTFVGNKLTPADPELRARLRLAVARVLVQCT